MLNLLSRKKNLRKYFKDISVKRNIPFTYDQFEFVQINTGTHRLHLDVLEYDHKEEIPTIVFMPGTNAYSMLYNEFLTQLRDNGFNVIGFDPRGHGRSDGKRGSYTISELLEDMDAVVAYARQRFGSKIYLAGSSQGGITAFYYAAKPYQNIRGAICHNAAELTGEDSLHLTRNPTFSRYLKPILEATEPYLPETPIPMNAYLDLKKEPVNGMGTAADVIMTDPLCIPYVRLKTLHSLSNTPLPVELGDIETPLYFLHGAKDTIFPEWYMQKLYDQLTMPLKKMRVYSDLYHYLIVDNAPAIVPDIVDWINEVEAAYALK